MIILEAAGCGALVESCGIRPGASWGTANATVQAQYRASNCNVKICVYWKKKNSVVPFVTYGSLSADLQPLWDLPRNGDGQTCNELSGRLSLTECSAVSERCNLLALVSSGSATPNVLALFSSSGCDTSICTVWRRRYGVTPYVSYGSLPDSYKASWDAVRASSNKTCNDLAGLLDSSECGALVETYGIVPGSSWGSAGANVQGLYTASFCNRSVCAYWRTKYSVVPFLGWGSLPHALQNAWNFARQPAGQTCNELSGSLTASDCEALQLAYGIVAFGGWGTAPTNVQRMWNSSKCDMHACRKMVFPVPNCQIYLG
ncbi:hypothetical protein HYH03_008681 [Edaphochlamys debaryana]|uniref:Uncharacterized protein n=1 Tax=Edaphochlamys debaryana TaxID=47281 RepID=A0A836BZ45_9CHLO|nr:hypothetical protein HYH03_008681 [Edaphochlamys debaryana]|eukprot:KAG2493018.1 hypothetical protein HYH03_008681 [Edaphochlamys debaryana]